MSPYGVTLERRLQLGQEGTPGTAVAASAIWRGQANSILDERVVVHPPENVGYSAPMARVYTPFLAASYAMPDSEVTFEQGPYILAAAMKSLVTGVADGGTSTAKIYAYPWPVLLTNHTYKTFTLEAGNNNDARKMEYSFVDKWGISGAPKQALMWKGVHWVGRQRTAVTFASIAPPAVEPINFQMGYLYVDSGGGSIGATPYTNAWLGFDLACDSGLRSVPTGGNGQLYFSFAKPTGVTCTGSLTVEDDSQATGLETDWIANTLKLIRMKFTGSATGGAGGTYSVKTMIIDLAIYIDKIDILASQNGNDTKKVNFTVVYSPTDSLFGSMTFVNLLTALP